jgi:hypothetical protein
MKQTKEDAREVRRILGRVALDGREPTEMEFCEGLCLKPVRGGLRDDTFTLALLRGPCEPDHHVGRDHDLTMRCALALP